MSVQEIPERPNAYTCPPAIGLGSPTYELLLHTLIGCILLNDISHSVGISSL